MKRRIASFALAAALLALAQPAFACMGDKVLYDEDFSFVDAGWGPLGPNFEISNGAATSKPAANATSLHINPNFAFSDADICLTLTQSDITDPTNAYGGLLFWAKDSNNFMAFVYATNGYFEVLRYLNGSWSAASPVPWTQTAAIKQGVGVPNTLRVTIQGQLITLGVDGTQVARFRAQPPDGGTGVGMFAASESIRSDTFAFQDLKVTNVIDTTATASPPAQ